MRKARLLGDGTSVYHCMSRIVDRRFVLGVEERHHFVKLMRKMEAFSGVRVLTYCVMSNHFHILVEVPDREKVGEVSEEEVLKRVRALYGRTYAKNLEYEFRNAHGNGLHDLAEAIRQRYASRMFDLSEFIKGIKQRFTQWFNTSNGRKGTLWEDRFKSVLVQDTQDALLTMGAYIDLNPVRAGICADPKDYRECGYAEAVAGRKPAREGISRMLQAFDSAPASETMDTARKPTWREAGKAYRELLFGTGEEQTSADGEVVRKGIPAAEVEEAVRKGHKLTVAEIIRCRVRYFCDGLIFGTATYVEKVFKKSRSHFGENRKTAARKMRGADWGDLRTARDLRVRVFGSG